MTGEAGGHAINLKFRDLFTFTSCSPSTSRGHQLQVSSLTFEKYISVNIPKYSPELSDGICNPRKKPERRCDIPFSFGSGNSEGLLSGSFPAFVSPSRTSLEDSGISYKSCVKKKILPGYHSNQLICLRTPI